MSIRSINQTEKWVEHTHKVLEQAKDITSAAVDIETGMRGYLLAGKEGFLDPYKRGEKHTYERIDKPRGEFFHTNWTGRGGTTASSTYNV